MSEIPPPDDAPRIDHLRFHWGDDYSITHYEGGDWRALWRDDLSPPLIADSADELLELIRADHFWRTGPKPTDQGSL
jgi:hypothetical protein